MDGKTKQEVIDWLSEIFEKKNFENLVFEFPEYDGRGGLAAEIIFVDLTGTQNGLEKKYELLIKKSKENKAVLDTLELRRGYACEVEFYSKTVPFFRQLAEENNCVPFDNIPKCYGTIQRDDHFVVVLENLKPKNFGVANILKPLDFDHMKLVMEAYAKWHAFNFAMKEQKAGIYQTLGNNMIGFEETKVFQILVNTLQKEIAFVIDFYNTKNKPHIVEKLKKLDGKVAEHSRDCFANKNENYYVIRHGDCWNNNFLFHYNEKDNKPDQVVIIDWQMGLLGSPMADVSQFIFYCSSRKELECLDELLYLYYKSLSQKLRELGSDPEECFPWKACKKAFERYAPLAIAGMTVSVRLSYMVQPDMNYDIVESLEDNNFRGLFGEGLRDPDEYFERIDGILEFCVNKGYI